MTLALDEARVKEVAGRLLAIYTGSVLTKAIALGHETGALEALAAAPGTVEEVASRAGLQERYVREWLGLMACGGLVDYDQASLSYALPAELAALLTGPTARNLAPMSGVLEAIGKRREMVARCFREGGGVPYSEFMPDFTTQMDGGWRRIYDQQLLDAFLPIEPDLLRRLEAGCSALDVGCGTGHAINLMARAFPRSRFAGYDLNEQAIALAREEAASMGLANARFEVLDVAALPLEPTWDIVFAFDAIHDQVDPAGVLRGVHEALAPGGIFFAVDFKFASNLAANLGNPFAGLYYGISLMHCMTVSLAEGGAGLGAVWGMELATRMLHEAGFSTVAIRDTPRPQNCVYVCRS